MARPLTKRRGGGVVLEGGSNQVQVTPVWASTYRVVRTKRNEGPSINTLVSWQAEDTLESEEEQTGSEATDDLEEMNEELSEYEEEELSALPPKRP